MNFGLMTIGILVIGVAMSLSNIQDSDVAHLVEGDFAEAVTHRNPAQSEPSEIRGLFDSNYVEIQPGGGVDVASSSPRLILTVTTVSDHSINNNSFFTIRGDSYSVTEHIEDDSAGVFVFYLKRGSP